MTFHGLRRARTGSAPSLPRRSADRLTTLTQASLTLQTARWLRPASHPASRPRTGASLPGTQASPRTGLTPAGRPELVAPLRHVVLHFLMAPEQSRRTTRRQKCVPQSDGRSVAWGGVTPPAGGAELCSQAKGAARGQASVSDVRLPSHG